MWIAPPVPESWWPVIRAEMPPFDPRTTPTSGLGVLAEYFRTYPGTLRSDHPNLSFSARGKYAASLLQSQPFDSPFGEESPLGRFITLDGYVLLLGVTHDANTTLHLAEHRAEWSSKKGIQQGAAVMRDGVRQWVTLNELIDYDADDFEQLGADYEREIGYQPSKVGQADTRFHRAAPLVEFATRWIAQHRS
jgi:aminoglycoside 3-N-acetyltransferase